MWRTLRLTPLTCNVPKMILLTYKLTHTPDVPMYGEPPECRWGGLL
jgi:hypothetical protein